MINFSSDAFYSKDGLETGPPPSRPADVPIVCWTCGTKGQRMSEHQYVAFRAIDGPVSEEESRVHASAVIAGRDHTVEIRE